MDEKIDIKKMLEENNIKVRKEQQVDTNMEHTLGRAPDPSLINDEYSTGGVEVDTDELMKGRPNMVEGVTLPTINKDQKANIESYLSEMNEDIEAAKKRLENTGEYTSVADLFVNDETGLVVKEEPKPEDDPDAIIVEEEIEPKVESKDDFQKENKVENEELSETELEEVIAKDRERLKKMTYYCYTKDCLREYMLGYFGEPAKGYCGNCSNCLQNYEEVDVSKYARIMLCCIEECRERYGVTTILETLHGSRSEKVLRYRLNENSYYATATDISMERLRQIVKQLLAKGYLNQTDDEYGLLKLTERSYDITVKGEQIMLKLPKEKEPVTVERRVQLKTKSSIGRRAASNNPQLYELLRCLRNETAKNMKVPAYVVFTDKTLQEMSTYLPVTRDEMLEISGVAQAKYEKYGELFMNVIREYKEQHEQEHKMPTARARIKF